MPLPDIQASVGGLILALVLFGASGQAAAQQQPDTAVVLPNDTAVVELPGIEVVASILSGAGPRIGSGIPARATVMVQKDVDAWEPRLLSEALASQPGISLYDDLGSPFKTTLVTRGFTASPVVGLPQGVSVFIDGVPINEPDAGQVNFDLMPLEHVERVELLSGTASLLGPHSLGGGINLVTRRGHGAPAGEVELSSGSHGSYSVGASAGGSAGEWSYYAGGGYAREAGWRQLTSATMYDALVNVGRVNARRGIHLQAIAAKSRAETAGSLPLSVFTVRPDSNLSAGDFEDLSQLHVAVSGYAPLGAGRGSFRAYLRGHDAERFNVNQVNDPDVRSFSENRTLGASADWRWARPTAGGSLALRAGAGGSVSRVAIRIFAERIDPGLTTHVESPIADVGVYSVVDYARGPFTFSGGLRADAVRIPFRNRLNPQRDTTSVFTRLSPRGGVRLDVGRGASVYTSVGQSFRAPAVIELACADPENPCPLPFALGDDPPLDPVVATTYEAGARWLRGPLTLGASAYHTDVRDDIFLFPYEEENEPEGSTIDGFFANIGSTRREGIELDSRLALRGGHSLFLNYAYTIATFQVDEIELFSIREEAGGENEIEEGDRLPLIPDHTLRAGALAALTRGLELGVNASYTGRRWLRGDEANEEEPLDGYWLADVRLAYSVGGWEVRGVVHNVLDTSYAAFGTFNLNQGAGGALERFLTPGRPRIFRLAVERAFGMSSSRTGR
jgi:iron complex outermembrane receptor protein